MPGREHQRADPSGHLLGEPRLEARRPGPLGALEFVVRRSGVVDRVVEPQRQLHFRRMDGLRPDRRDEGQAIVEVGRIVVGPVGLGVPVHDLPEERVAWRRHAQRLPRRAPLLGGGHLSSWR